MNKVILMGRLTRDPEVRYSKDESPLAVAHYTLAVNRPYKKAGSQETDFISCVAFGRSAEFTEKYLRQGMRIVISGRIQTGSYTNKNGAKIYTTDVIVEEQEFAESKKVNEKLAASSHSGLTIPESGEFVNIPEGIDDELPFS